MFGAALCDLERGIPGEDDSLSLFRNGESRTRGCCDMVLACVTSTLIRFVIVLCWLSLGEEPRDSYPQRPRCGCPYTDPEVNPDL